MPINREKGEIIGDLGTEYRVASLTTWADTPLYRQAEDSAAAAFIASGAVVPFCFRDEDVLVQEYTSKNKLAFLFQRTIAGKEHFYPYVFDLSPSMVSQLRLIGRWGYSH